MDFDNAALVRATRDIVLADSPAATAETFSSRRPWRDLRATGSRLWLDTGDIEAAEALWTPEMSALTTNNTLLNRQVQKGIYDEWIAVAAARLAAEAPTLTEAEQVREIAFILNARHALRLVRRFDACVSVELHTDLAFDIDGACAFARRYHALCPERFIVKVPLTAEGLVAAARLGREGVPINLTLGFSARQNWLIAAVARPRYCNVFLGRLNQFAVTNRLGPGTNVGEKALAASQRAVRRLRERGATDTLQIAASLRSGGQIGALAGVDVLTMPPKVAREFLDGGGTLGPGVEGEFEPTWADGIDLESLAVDTLWNIPDTLPEAAGALAAADPANLDGPAVRAMLAERGLGDLLPAWTDEDRHRAQENGKIPNLDSWRYRLAGGAAGLDALMTLSGLMSFAADQEALDDRIRRKLAAG